MKVEIGSKFAPAGARVASRAFLVVHALRQRLGRAAHTIPILSFHRVSAVRPEHYMTFLPESFAHLLREMKRHYTFVSLAEIDDLLSRQRLDAPVAGVAFDDTYGCNAKYAVPVLEAERVPATFFVSSGFVDSDRAHPDDQRLGYGPLPNFTSAELRAMAGNELFEIGSHTVSHIDLSRDWDDARVRQELSESKTSLEQTTGRPVTRFAFPYGSRAHCRVPWIRIARECGYTRVYSFFGGRNRLTPGASPGYVLQRICPTYEDPDFVRACLENYRGRDTSIPVLSRKPALSVDFHPTRF
jgi:peptidoglycan/xylan/chitin deacetylase (PgdA/CDA1 family)